MQDLRGPLGMLLRVDGHGRGRVCFRGKCTVGRKSGCTLTLSGNKLVSGKHCNITRDSSGVCWLEDTSTHGTVVNRNVMVKGRAYAIMDGDVLYFSYRPKTPEQNTSFVYYSLTSEDDAPEADTSLSVEPLMVSDAPLDVTGERPWLSCSFSHLCIQCHVGSHRMTSSVEFDFSLRIEMMKTDNVELKTKKKKKDEQKKLETKAPVKDAMEETLTCAICQDLVYNCVSLQPCMHIFCASCYSGWTLQSSFCPICRCHVENFNKNHILNNLVEAYLVQHPEKRRSEHDSSTMDSEDTINKDPFSEYLNLVSSDNESDDDIDLIQDYYHRVDPPTRQHVDSLRLRFPTFHHEQRRQPSTSSAVRPADDTDQSHVQTDHLQCNCCGDLMLDQRLDTEAFPAQSCVRCHQHFCNSYLGCWTNCGGCLGPFTELDLGDCCMQKIVNGNEHESEILQNYLTSRSMTWRDMVREACHDVQRGKYTLSSPGISAQSALCVPCALEVLKDVAYRYRENIPAAELPDEATTRPDCRWGRSCCRQVWSQHHAQKLNHICEESRLKA